jgi:hypothetical protein
MLMTVAYHKEPKMTRQSLAKPTPFGVPSLETADRIDVSDMCAALSAAQYRFHARMRELEQHFEAKASELRTAYLDECALAQAVLSPHAPHVTSLAGS